MSPQKYVYTNGARHYRGYFFHSGKPVTITDRATLAAIQKEKHFELVEEKTEAEAKVLAKDECPKCGKVIKQGMYMHQKWCRG